MAGQGLASGVVDEQVRGANAEEALRILQCKGGEEVGFGVDEDQS